MTIKISDDVREVLRASTITASSVRLPDKQLDRTLYTEVNKVLDAAGGKWNRKAKAHLFTRDPREQLADALETGKTENRKQQFQAFYTPAAVARRVIAAAGIERGHRVLEPSAGHGALADLVRDADANVKCFDIDVEAVQHLERAGHYAEACDFLAMDPDDYSRFDVVVMNPPFTKGQDIAHVTHALRFVKAGGRLVSITAPSWLKSGSKKAKAFRDLLAAQDDWIYDGLPAASFKASGTNVNAILLTVTKAR
jgi:predicted RNA methylase